MPMSPRLLRPRQVGGFDPRRISGIGGWFDATDASTYTLDTGVSEWRCKAVSGQKFSQTSGASQPTINATGIGGKAALSFDGSNDWMDLGSQTIGGNSLFAEATNPFSLFCVLRSAVQGAGFRTFLAKAGATPAVRTLQLYQNISIIGGVIRGTTGDHTANSFPQLTDGMARLVWTGSDATSGFNNNTFSPGIGTASVESQNVTLGCRTASTPSVFWNGLISEVVFYNKALSVSEQSALFAYLNAKWGLSLT